MRITTKLRMGPLTRPVQWSRPSYCLDLENGKGMGLNVARTEDGLLINKVRPEIATLLSGMFDTVKGETNPHIIILFP